MEKLKKRYSSCKMKHIRASRVDYYTQHCVETWMDHLGSLGLEGESCVFVNLAAIVHPERGHTKDGLGHVNYSAPVAAARACERLGFGHWIQSSTQATSAERAGQVP